MNLTRHGECKESHLMATKFKQFWIKLAKSLTFLYEDDKESFVGDENDHGEDGTACKSFDGD